MTRRAALRATRRYADYVCPQCRDPVGREKEAYHCARCAIIFPVLFGIPDFRLSPDRYLSLSEERAKAKRLHDYAQTHSFAETVAEYYRITDDVSPEMAVRFSEYVLAGEARGSAALGAIPARDAGAGRLLDVGCGAGGTVAAAARTGRDVTGIDIALRWLVIAQKRLQEEGLSGELVCGDIANPPFADKAFDCVIATDLFEHLPDPDAGAGAIRSLLAPSGQIYATGANRLTVTRYAPAGLWGVGYLPTSLRRRYVVWRCGIDTLRFLKMQSPSSLSRLFARAGFTDIRPSPLTISSDRGATLKPFRRLIFGLYRALCRVAITRAVLVRVGPVFEISAINPATLSSTKRTTS